MSNIAKIISSIQQKLKAPKGQLNKFGNYKYRSCEDIVEAVKPLLAEHDAYLNISDQVVLIGDRYYVQATAKIIANGESVESIAYAREPAVKKGADEAQITGATSSYARKYALNGLLAIDDTKDADSNEHSKAAETKASKDSNMSGKPVDVSRLMDVVTAAIDIVDSNDMDEGPHEARKLYEPLNNDERMFVNGKLREKTFVNADTGRENQYWAAFKKYLEMAA